jgi:YesN/AraC family two-component response regulator
MKKVRILIVEDEILVARDLQMHLEQMGYTVAGMVPSGKQAIQEIENEVPDLVLTDIVLQEGMDGIETAEIIHSRFDIPVIFRVSPWWNFSFLSFAFDSSIFPARRAVRYGRGRFPVRGAMLPFLPNGYKASLF